MNIENDSGPRFRISIDAADTENESRFAEAILNKIRDALRKIATNKDMAATNAQLGLTRGAGSVLSASEQSHIFSVETPAALTLSPSTSSTWPRRRSNRESTQANTSASKQRRESQTKGHQRGTSGGRPKGRRRKNVTPVHRKHRRTEEMAVSMASTSCKQYIVVGQVQGVGVGVRCANIGNKYANNKTFYAITNACPAFA